MKALLFAVLLAASSSHAQPAALGSIRGRVSLSRPGVVKASRIGPGPVSFKPGDVLRTAHSGAAYVAFPDGSTMTLGRDSVVVVKEYEQSAVQLFLKFGELKAKVSKRRGRVFSVHTPAAVASVRGTEFSVRVDETGKSGVAVTEGLVAVKAHKKSFWKRSEVMLSAGESVSADADSGLGRVSRGSLREASWAVPGSDQPKR